eukprot:CAMPEP_0117513182 /NCGR_PEP_ID=MMETSP0784-20121206/29420_1 /TAXON_ID=39447 /ORGANISM="" /LENGTH=397 /DNA_ID=CAMNT_0005308935 /DNA_START=60 /DNA_END=1253 /DNA_ORIENTATION=-
MAPSAEEAALLLRPEAAIVPREQPRVWRRAARFWEVILVGLAFGGLLLCGASFARLRAGVVGTDVKGSTGLFSYRVGSQPPPSTRIASFLVIGDWGWDQTEHGNVQDNVCQRSIADKMLATMEDLGDVKFVINVGDSFYPRGVVSKSDPQWDIKWRNVYADRLRSVPWYSVYGNHDYLQDPCACGVGPEMCAQVNANPWDLNFFYMPYTSWFKAHPELGLEVVALDLNHYVMGWNKTRTAADQRFEDCSYTACEKKCLANSKARANEAFQLFEERVSKSTAKNLLVFSHYPTDYFSAATGFLASLSDATRHKVVYFGGHRHSVDQNTIPTFPNVNWLVGGGGGWSCDGTHQGFVVGEISSEFQVATYSVLVDQAKCCPSSYSQTVVHMYEKALSWLR